MGKGRAGSTRPRLALVVIDQPSVTHAQLRAAVQSLLDQLETEAPALREIVREAERSRNPVAKVVDAIWLGPGPIDREWWQAEISDRTVPKLRAILSVDAEQASSNEALLPLQRALVDLADQLHERATHDVGSWQQTALRLMASRIYGLLEHLDAPSGPNAPRAGS